MAKNPEQSWGTWSDAERWREEAFQERSAAARLAWLEEVWRMREVAQRTGSTYVDDVSPIHESGWRRGS